MHQYRHVSVSACMSANACCAHSTVSARVCIHKGIYMALDTSNHLHSCSDKHALCFFHSLDLVGSTKAKVFKYL